MEEYISLIIGSLVVGFIAALVTCIVIVVKYKTKLKAPIYPIDKYCDLSLIDTRDDYIGSTVTRVRVSTSRKR